MFSIDKWQEIFSTMSRNPLRVVLTAFSVSWGIFMLIILLGFGQGLQNGVEKDFMDDANNSIWVNSGKTTMAYKGFKEGRRVELTNDDYEHLGVAFKDQTTHVAARKDFWSMTTDIKWKNNFASFNIVGADPNYRYLEALTITQGRFLNQDDYDKARKVCVLGMIAKNLLFPPGYNPVGEFISVNGVPFKVIGVFEDQGGDRDMRRMYFPVTTGQRLYNDPNKVSTLVLLTNTMDVESSKKLEKDVTKRMKEVHGIHPDDERAIRIWNNVENFMQFRNMFAAIEAFIWAIGIMTIGIGIVGVGNIMLITVKERTKEIGIRKALGATPGSIIGMILQEAVLITIVAGYVGMVLGIALIELVASFIPDVPPGGGGPGGGMNFMGKPEVDFETAAIATLVLIVAGTIAGLIPAIKAANVNPISAIRNE